MSRDKKITIIKVDGVFGRIMSTDAGIMDALYRNFSIYIKNHWFDPRVKNGKWDGKIHFVKRNGEFYNGLFERIHEWLKCQKEYELEIDPEYFHSKKELASLKKEFIESMDLLNLPFLPYDYQMRGALKALFFKNAICEHATGSGKSLTITLVINFLMTMRKEEKHKVLILVPKIDLVEQFYENLIEYGIPEDMIGKYCGYQKDTDEPIIVSTWQSIYKKPNFLKQFTCFIGDECHGLKAKFSQQVGENVKNAEYRLGFTGTLPEIEKGHTTDRYLIEGITGEVKDIVTIQELQEAKRVADIKIDIPYLIYKKEDTEHLRNIYKNKELSGSAKFAHEKDFIVHHKRRNLLISKITEKFIKKKENVMILASRKAHIDNIKNKLEKIGITPFIITGDVKNKDELNAPRHALEESGGHVIIATTSKYSTGVSINRLHAVIFADAGQSKITTLQAVGRGLRLHKSKEKLHLYDVSDDLKYSGDHVQERIEYYNKNNFEVEIKEINM